jgi:hypothetical protein
LDIDPGFTRWLKIPSLLEHPLVDFSRGCHRGGINCLNNLCPILDVATEFDAQCQYGDQDKSKESRQVRVYQVERHLLVKTTTLGWQQNHFKLAATQLQESLILFQQNGVDLIPESL